MLDTNALRLHLDVEPANTPIELQKQRSKYANLYVFLSFFIAIDKSNK